MKKLIHILLAVCLITGIYAQKPDTSIPQLKNDDVERFINHYKSIVSDFEKLDVKFHPESDLESFTNAIDNLDEVNAVVRKYGYKDIDSFVTQTWAISVSYASITVNIEELKEYKEAKEEIQNSTELTDEQKSQAIARLEQVIGAMASAFGSMVNEKDIETVRPYMNQLKEILDED